MYYFIPAWYGTDRIWHTTTSPWYWTKDSVEFDDTINQLRIFQDAGIERLIIIPHYSPQLRYFLHRQDLLETDYISVFDVHQKQINISRDKEQIVSPKMVKDEYFNIISYDLNAAGFPSKKTEVYQLLGEKEYRGSHVINQYYADNKDYIPVTLYKVGNNASKDIMVDITNQKVENIDKFGDLQKTNFSYGGLELGKGGVFDSLRKLMEEKYHLNFAAGYINTNIANRDPEKIDISNTNFAQDYPEMAKDIKNLARLYMRPNQYSTKEWFDTVLHWFAPRGEDVLEIYATDPKSGEKTQIKSYDELMVWSANHPE